MTTLVYFCETPRCPLAPKMGDKFCERCTAEKVNVSMAEKPTPVPEAAPLCMAVPVELVRELKAAVEQSRLGPRAWNPGPEFASVRLLLDKLPSPPPLDPVEECTKAAAAGTGRVVYVDDIRRALRKFKELGCPEIPE